MSDTFTASNGVTVSIEPEGDTFLKNVPGVTGSVWLRKETTSALREFFLHELGIWQDPETGALVKRTPGRDDRDGRAVSVWGGDQQRSFWERYVAGDRWLEGAARAYFAAHPEPKPWMNVADGVYAVSPQVHPSERLLQKRDGEWIHLYRSTSENASEPHVAEFVAEVAYKEQRLTRLLPEVSP